jgi:hypothetical protein
MPPFFTSRLFQPTTYNRRRICTTDVAFDLCDGKIRRTAPACCCWFSAAELIQSERSSQILFVSLLTFLPGMPRTEFLEFRENNG